MSVFSRLFQPLTPAEIILGLLLIMLGVYISIVSHDFRFAGYCILTPILFYFLGSRTNLFSHSYVAIELLYYTAAIIGVGVVFLKTQHIREINEIDGDIAVAEERLTEYKQGGFLLSKNETLVTQRNIFMRDAQIVFTKNYIMECPKGDFLTVPRHFIL